MNFEVILLQEVRFTQSQLDSYVVKFGCSSLVNIDSENIEKPRLVAVPDRLPYIVFACFQNSKPKGIFPYE